MKCAALWKEIQQSIVDMGCFRNQQKHGETSKQIQRHQSLGRIRGGCHLGFFGDKLGGWCNGFVKRMVPWGL
jgi:hypothetical protein